ncbi:hypothetical protein SAMN05216179_0288 [Gracilibacillus kekensis]|uniref:Transporter n=2 Tax=Gracilibacillus kekensis TaxID=1027249 RepID=A0A1M7J954_9BACI|nr:hypothetical protein SAMN05216179_0288 [Gracilibacillus kekensis]
MMESMYPTNNGIYDEYGNMYQDDRQIGFFPFFPGLFPGGSSPGQGGPPFGPPPGQGQPGPPFGPPPGQGQQAGPPLSPPPQYVPQQPAQAGSGGPQLFAVDPGSIRGCLYRFTYVWLSRFNAFWFYPTYVGRRSVAGYRWTGFNWVYFGIDLERIQSFTCV